MVSDQIIRRLETRALNALPALDEEEYDGWVLRATRGYTGRANSVAPLDDGRLPVGDKINTPSGCTAVLVPKHEK